MSSVEGFKNGKIPEVFKYIINGKEVEKEEFINYIVEMCKQNDNHIPHID